MVGAGAAEGVAGGRWWTVPLVPSLRQHQEEEEAEGVRLSLVEGVVAVVPSRNLGVAVVAAAGPSTLVVEVAEGAHLGTQACQGVVAALESQKMALPLAAASSTSAVPSEPTASMVESHATPTH